MVINVNNLSDDHKPFEIPRKIKPTGKPKICGSAVAKLKST